MTGSTVPVPPGFRAGYVAIVGEPNVGKSTLLNRLLQFPLSIVAAKPQTTRHRIVGIGNGPDYQAVFVDTPGLLTPAYRLQQFMLREVRQALEDADVVLLLVDARRPGFGLPDLPAGRPTVVAINKIDLVRRGELLPQIQALARPADEPVLLVSALKGDGVEDLRQALVSRLPAGEPFFPRDALTERPERFYAGEIVREAMFRHYGEEIPYSTAVVVEEFAERPGRKDYVRATIYVERESQKAIVIGRGGQALRRVGSVARRRLERFLGRPAYLELQVKVAGAWRRSETFLRENVYRPEPGATG